MGNQAERVIQAELKSFPAYEQRSRPAKAREISALDAYPADELHQFASVGHGRRISRSLPVGATVRSR
jgi:hypothetical protein